jgi:hypothetical protein
VEIRPPCDSCGQKRDAADCCGTGADRYVLSLVAVGENNNHVKNAANIKPGREKFVLLQNMLLLAD